MVKVSDRTAPRATRKGARPNAGGGTSTDPTDRNRTAAGQGTPGVVQLDFRAGQSLYDAFIASGFTSTDYSAWVREREQESGAVGGIKALHHLAPDVPPLGHQCTLTLPLDSTEHSALLSFRTNDADIATAVVTECYNRGIFTLPDFVQSYYDSGEVAHVQFRIQMLCSAAARRVVVQDAVRYQFLVHLNSKCRPGQREYSSVAALNFDAPDIARRWAKFLRKRPALAPWFAERTHSPSGRLVPEVAA